MTFQGPPPAAPAGPPPAPSRRRRALLPTVIVMAVLVVTYLLFVSFYTDWLWFKEVGFTSVFTKVLLARAGLFAVFFSVMFFAVVLNGYLAYRYRPPFRSISLEQQSLDRYRVAIDPFRRTLLVGIGAMFGFFLGVSALAEWRPLLAWLNRTSFGVVDPQFGLDVSFFTFTLPWLRFVLGAVMWIVAISTLMAALVHYLYGGFRLQTPGEKTTPAARAHLSILIGLFVLLKAGAYFLDRFELLVSNFNPDLTGAGYTQIKAVLPAKNILMVIALICAVLFFANVFRRTWSLAVLALGLLVVSAFIIGGVYPALVQRFTVAPSAVQKQQPYIERNITSTRKAYQLDTIKKQDYSGLINPTKKSFADSRGTIDNVRLMDPSLLAPTYDQLQQIRGYYGFQDPLDIGRYNLTQQQQSVVISARELDMNGIPEPQRNWINEHLVYTHGYGIVAAPDDQVTADGQPNFIEYDIPPKGVLDVKQPRIYYGELSPSYSIVGAGPTDGPRELDYPDDSTQSGQRNNTYDGSGGVPIGSFFNKLLYATKYQEGNILFSDLVNVNSKILYNREPRARVQAVAPWLTLDADPYPAVVDGRITWIIDGYTTTAGIPYSELVPFGDVTTDSLTAQQSLSQPLPQEKINYIRNSVKATVDAYDGTVTLYAWDESDPVLQTWMKAFPGTVDPKSAISDSLLQAFRYPEDLFKVQRELYASYHVTNPSTFFSGNDLWKVPADPTVDSATEVAQPPYYLTMQMPDQTAPSFSLTTPLAPNKRETLAAFMAVNSDPLSPDYGTIRVLELPRNNSLPGPSQMQNQFTSDTRVAEQFRLLQGGSSQILLGNLLSLPVAGGFMYVEPVYVQATSGAASYPLLRKVLVSFGSDVAMEDTFQQSLASLVQQSGGSFIPGGTGGGGGGGGGGANQTEEQKLVSALRDAQQAYDDGQQALKDGNFAAYGKAQDELSAALDRAAAAAQALGVPVPSQTPSPSTSPTPQATASTAANAA
ncbi:MAG: UPF0182 family protein [Actinomycetes bacterium]